jgi:hypothetical protein
MPVAWLICDSEQGSHGLVRVTSVSGAKGQCSVDPIQAVNIGEPHVEGPQEDRSLGTFIVRRT